MANGKTPDVWIKCAKEVGHCMADFHHSGSNPGGLKFDSPCPLLDWLKTLPSSDDEFKNMLPDRLRTHIDMPQMRKRQSQAMKLFEQRDGVNSQAIYAKNIKPDDGGFKINASAVHLTDGPCALDAAMFEADLIMMYYKQMGVVEHAVQYKTVDTLNAFGQAFSEQMQKHGADEEHVEKLWANVSLLTGWEVIRRYLTKDNIDAILERAEHDPSSVVEAGVRLIYNERVKNPNFLVCIALALLG